MTEGRGALRWPGIPCGPLVVFSGSRGGSSVSGVSRVPGVFRFSEFLGCFGVTGFRGVRVRRAPEEPPDPDVCDAHRDLTRWRRQIRTVTAAEALRILPLLITHRSHTISHRALKVNTPGQSDDHFL